MISVVIAAHNEAAVIERCLSALQHCGQSLDITVSANGCNDATAHLARRAGVRVIEVEEASKAVALNRGDAVAIGFPRFYLDADIEVIPDTFARFSAAFEDDDAILAVGPRRRVEISGRPLLVRAYYAVHSRTSDLQRGLFGRGLMGVSAAGRGRFDRFPLMVADDLFLDSVFAPSEKIIVDSVEVAIAAPRHTRDLLRRLVRVRRGNAAMRQAGHDGSVNTPVRRADRLAWLRVVVLPHPHLAPAGLTYAAITVIAAVLAKREPRPSNAWARDESTRQVDPDAETAVPL